MDLEQNEDDFDASCNNKLESIIDNDNTLNSNSNNQQDFISPEFKNNNYFGNQESSQASKASVAKLNIKNLNYKTTPYLDSSKKGNMTDRSVNISRLSEMSQPKQIQVRKQILNQVREHRGEKGLHESMTMRQMNKNNVIKIFEEKFKKNISEILDRTEMQKANFSNEVHYGSEENIKAEKFL